MAKVHKADHPPHPSAGEGVEPPELSVVADQSAKWCRHWEDSSAVSYKLHIVLPYHPAIILLGAYPDELKAYVYTHKQKLQTNQPITVMKAMSKGYRSEPIQLSMTKTGTI